MSVAEWDNEYARLARAASQLRSGVVGVGGNDASGLRTSLQRLEANLEQLPLQPTEIQRRRRLIQHLTDSSGGGGVAGMEAGQSHNPHPQQQQQQQQQSLAQTKMQRALQDQDAMIDELATGNGPTQESDSSHSRRSGYACQRVTRIGSGNAPRGTAQGRSIRLALATDCGGSVHSVGHAHFDGIFVKLFND